jgi:hypothetical protein
VYVALVVTGDCTEDDCDDDVVDEICRHDDCREFARPYGLTDKHCPDPRLTPGGVAAVVVCTLLCFFGCFGGGLYWHKQRAHKHEPRPKLAPVPLSTSTASALCSRRPSHHPAPLPQVQARDDGRLGRSVSRSVRWGF